LFARGVDRSFSLPGTGVGPQMIVPSHICRRISAGRPYLKRAERGVGPVGVFPLVEAEPLTPPKPEGSLSLALIFSMISFEIRIKPSVCDSSGERFRVQERTEENYHKLFARLQKNRPMLFFAWQTLGLRIALFERL